MAKIVVDKRVMQNFTRRAIRRYPKEYVEVVFGRIKGDTVFIHAFYPLNHTSTPFKVDYTDADIEAVQDVAEDENLVNIGTIHSHPNCMAVPSPTDLLSAAQDRETVMGICSIEKKGERLKTRTLFWPVIIPLGIEFR